MFPYYRLNKIFHHIHNEQMVPVTSLCELFNITDRTLRTYIQMMNNTLEKHGAIIKLKRKCGYYIEVMDQAQYDAFLIELAQTEKYSIELDSTKDRVKHLLNILMYQKEYISLEELAEQVFVSINTLKNYIKTLNDLLSKYDLELITKASLGVKIIGDENNKRKCLLESILNKNLQDYITEFSKEEHLLFKGIDLNQLRDILYHKLKILDIEINDYNFKNLVIHFALMISRIKKNYCIETNIDFKIDSSCLDLIEDLSHEIEKHFNLHIPEGEKQYMYSHLVANSHLDDLINKDIQIKELVFDLLNTIYLDYNFDLRNDEILSNDLFLHLNSMLNTKYLALNKRNPLLNTIKANFPLAFDITLSCVTKVFKNLPYQLTEDEVGYISLHIGAGLERCFSGSIKVKNVILICGSGQATSRMLETRLNIFFKDKIHIHSCMSYNHFMNYPKSELINIDFVISTIPITTDIPHVVVNFALQRQDIEAISRLLTQISHNKTKNAIDFFDKNLFLYLEECHSKTDLLNQMFEVMKENDVIDEEFIESVLERETLSKTNMNDLFALPHPIKLCAKQTKVAVAISKDPILWGENASAQVIFLLAIKQGDQQNIEHLYDIFIEIVKNTSLLQQLLQSTTFEDFITRLYTNTNN